MITRRIFLIRFASFITAITGMIGCRSSGPVKNKYESATGRDALMDAMVDTFVPKDEFPGAVEAGVSEVMARECEANDSTAYYVEALLTRLESISQAEHGRPFPLLGIEDREQIMEGIFTSRDEESRNARAGFTLVRGKILNAYYLSPAGREMLGYWAPFPVGYPNFAEAPLMSP